MVPVPGTAALLALALLPAAVALVDVLRDDGTDLAVLLVALVVLLTAALGSALRHRHALDLRPDLVDWLRLQSAATGEPVERLADRCVAAYRAELTGPRREAG